MIPTGEEGQDVAGTFTPSLPMPMRNPTLAAKCHEQLAGVDRADDLAGLDVPRHQQGGRGHRAPAATAGRVDEAGDEPSGARNRVRSGGPSVRSLNVPRVKRSRT